MKIRCSDSLLGFARLGGALFGSEDAGAIHRGARDVEATLNRFHDPASARDGAAHFALSAFLLIFSVKLYRFRSRPLGR